MSNDHPSHPRRREAPDRLPLLGRQTYGETDLHRTIMIESIESLKLHYAGQQVYVSGNILLFYQPGNRRRHVSPDVLVVKGLAPTPRNYLLWEEGRPPQVVIEVTSESTRDEDLYDKFEIYRDQVQVAVVAYQVASGWRKPAVADHTSDHPGADAPRSLEFSARRTAGVSPPVFRMPAHWREGSQYHLRWCPQAIGRVPAKKTRHRWAHAPPFRQDLCSVGLTHQETE